MEIKAKNANPANYGGVRSKTEYIVVHWTSNQNDTAKNNADYFARENVGASAHYFVDEDEVWASVPENCVAWHCGAKKYYHPYCRNSNSIGVEMCLTGKGYVIRRGTIENAVRLVRAIMQAYEIPLENVVRHYDVTHKYCPGPFVDSPSMWDDFKAALAAEQEDEMKVYQYVKDMPDWAQASVTKAIKKGVVAMDAEGAVSIYECNLQPLVWMDRVGLLD